MDIFLDDQDYHNFLKRLWIALAKSQGSSLRMKAFDKGEFSLLSYCLMPNHFHLQIMQNTDLATGKLLSGICTSYSMYFNQRYKHVGHVFQDQYKAVPVKYDNQLVALSAYIHQNPKVAGIVEDLKDWPFSSYQEYIGMRREKVETNLILRQFRDREDYETFVSWRYEDILDLKEIEK